MKKYFQISMFISAVLVLACCDNKQSIPSNDYVPEEGIFLLNLQANVSPFSKATDTGFELSDTVGVSMLVPEWVTSKMVYANNVKYTFNADMTITSDTPIYWYDNVNQSAIILSYYPYTADYDVNDQWIFDVKKDQSTPEGYDASDLMFAYAEAKPTADPVKLTYNHMLSKLMVYVDNQLSDEVTDVFISDVYTSVKIGNILGGTASYSMQSDKGTVTMCRTMDADGTSVWTSIVVPQQLVAPKLIVATTSERYVFNVTALGNCFEPMTKVRANVVIDESTRTTPCVSVTAEISDWLSGRDMMFYQLPDDAIHGNVYVARPDLVKTYIAVNSQVMDIYLPEQGVAHGVVKWNNDRDSLRFSMPEKGNCQTILIPDLSEGHYTYNVYTYDDSGRMSMPYEVEGDVISQKSLDNMLTDACEAVHKEKIDIYMEQAQIKNVQNWNDAAWFMWSNGPLPGATITFEYKNWDGEWVTYVFKGEEITEGAWCSTLTDACCIPKDEVEFYYWTSYEGIEIEIDTLIDLGEEYSDSIRYMRYVDTISKTIVYDKKSEIW